MNWWMKIASLQKNKTKKGVEEAIKDRILSSPFFVALFKQHGVKMDKLDDLSIESADLDDKAHCMTGDDKMVINEPLVESKEIFKKFHYIAHELVHWLKGKTVGNTDRVENAHYFSDPEEVESFTTAIAYFMYEMRDSKDLQKLVQKEFLPLIKITIKDKDSAQKFLADRIKDAKAMLLGMSLCNCS